MAEHHPARHVDAVAMCLGKVRFADGIKAWRVVRARRRALRRKSEGGHVPRLYRCPCCGGWHLGTNQSRWSDG